MVASGAPVRHGHTDPDDGCHTRSDGDMDSDDLHNYLDQDPHVPATSAVNLGPYARFLADLPLWTDMSEDAYTKAFDALPLPTAGPAPPSLSIRDAIQARIRIYRYIPQHLQL